MENLDNEQLLDFLRKADLDTLQESDSNLESLAFRVFRRRSKDLPFETVRILLQKIDSETMMNQLSTGRNWTMIHQICCHPWTLEEIQELVETPHFQEVFSVKLLGCIPLSLLVLGAKENLAVLKFLFNRFPGFSAVEFMLYELQNSPYYRALEDLARRRREQHRLLPELEPDWSLPTFRRVLVSLDCVYETEEGEDAERVTVGFGSLEQYNAMKNAGFEPCIPRILESRSFPSPILQIWECSSSTDFRLKVVTEEEFLDFTSDFRDQRN